MAKSVKKRAASAAATRAKSRLRAQNTAGKDNPQQVRSGTKQATSIEMLRTTTGASIDALMKATGWQQHSVRGFLAGVVRKRLGLKLESAIVDGQRVYRITDGTGEKPSPVQARRSTA